MALGFRASEVADRAVEIVREVWMEENVHFYEDDDETEVAPSELSEVTKVALMNAAAWWVGQLTAFLAIGAVTAGDAAGAEGE
jgi:hypothetical protein